jgi:hypothetical protein
MPSPWVTRVLEAQAEGRRQVVTSTATQVTQADRHDSVVDDHAVALLTAQPCVTCGVRPESIQPTADIRRAMRLIGY